MRTLTRLTVVVLAALATTASAGPRRVAEPAHGRRASAVALGPGLRVLGAARAGERETGEVRILSLRGGAWRHVQTLVAPDPQEFSDFGVSVALAPGRLLVGAPLADDCDGAAYLYRRDGARWRFAAKLSPPAPEQVAGFGRVVCFEHGRPVIGAFARHPPGEAWFVLEPTRRSWSRRP